MIIKLSNITKTYNHSEIKTKVFSSLNLSIEENEIISFVGPNGCGKSTLLNIIANIDNNYDGSLEKSSEIKTSYMFQKDLLIPWRNALNNALLGVEIENNVSKLTKEMADKLFVKFMIDSKVQSFPSSLSGGEKQKVALIRTILPSSDLILLDEPFSAIDFQSKIMLYDYLYGYFKKKRKTVIIVTHDIEEAINLSNRVIVFNPRPEGICKIVNIDISDNDRNSVKFRNSPDFSNYFTQVWDCFNGINRIK